MKYEIWLDSRYSHFDYGVAHLDDGTTRELTTFYNVGNFKDSLHIGVAPVGYDFDPVLRWHPYPGVIEFYMWDAELESITFHNTGNCDIYIWEYAYLKPGESVEITQEQRGQNYDALSRWSPIGLGRLIRLSENEPAGKVGTYGLIATQLESVGPGFVRHAQTAYFVSAASLRTPSPVVELEAHGCVLTYNEDGHAILRADNSEYEFTYDKGDGNNE